MTFRRITASLILLLTLSSAPANGADFRQFLHQCRWITVEVLRAFNRDLNQKTDDLQEAKIAGIFVEIGGEGAPVAGQFFRYGQANRTVLDFSDPYAISRSSSLFPRDRATARGRMLEMLKYYKAILKNTKWAEHPDHRKFVLAKSIATGRENGRGWMGIQFESTPDAEEMPIVGAHFERMKRRSTVIEQYDLQMFGVSLLHAIFFEGNKTPREFIASLFRTIKKSAMLVDNIMMRGPFQGLLPDPLLLNVELAYQGHASRVGFKKSNSGAAEGTLGSTSFESFSPSEDYYKPDLFVLTFAHGSRNGELAIPEQFEAQFEAFERGLNNPKVPPRRVLDIQLPTRGDYDPAVLKREIAAALENGFEVVVGRGGSLAKQDGSLEYFR